MLRKLIKYDLKSTRIVGLSFLVAIGLALFWSLVIPSMANPTPWISTISTFMTIPTVVVLVFLVIGPTIMISIRFYRHVISDEAYLTFTLPVPRYYHILSKMIASAIWTFTSYIVLFVCLIMFAFGYISYLDIVTVPQDTVVSTWDPRYTPLIIEYIILGIVTLFTSPLIVFASLSFGQVITKKHKILGAIAAYFIINMVSNAASSIFSAIFYIGVDMSSLLLDESLNIQIMTKTIGMFAIFHIITSVALYFFTNYCLTKKLNLE